MENTFVGGWTSWDDDRGDLIVEGMPTDDPNDRGAIVVETRREALLLSAELIERAAPNYGDRYPDVPGGLSEEIRKLATFVEQGAEQDEGDEADKFKFVIGAEVEAFLEEWNYEDAGEAVEKFAEHLGKHGYAVFETHTARG